MEILQKNINKLEKYKNLLRYEKDKTYDIRNSSMALKLLRLADHYQNSKNYNGVNMLVHLMDCYSNIPSEKGGITFERLPKETEEKILLLYHKKINIVRYGTKSINTVLDNLINEND